MQFFAFARAAASCANAPVEARAETATNNIMERFISYSPFRGISMI
jgi:hypothetical protein